MKRQFIATLLLHGLFQRMNSNKIVMGVVLPILVWMTAIAVIVMVRTPDIVPDEEELETVPLVDSVKVQPYTDTFVIEADGIVVPFREIQLASQVLSLIHI